MTERKQIEAAIERTQRRMRTRRILDALMFQIACGATLALVPAVVGALRTSIVEAPFTFGFITIAAAIVLGVIPTIRRRGERVDATNAVDRAFGDDQVFLTAATMPERVDPWFDLHLGRMESRDLEDASRKAAPIVWPRAAPFAALALVAFSIAASLPRHRSAERLLIDRLAASISPNSEAASSEEEARFIEELRRARTVEEARAIAEAALQDRRSPQSLVAPTEGTRILVEALNSASEKDVVTATERLVPEIGVAVETDREIAAFLRHLAAAAQTASGSQSLREAAMAASSGDGKGAGASLLAGSRALSESFDAKTRSPIEEMALTALATLGGEGSRSGSIGANGVSAGRADPADVTLSAMTSSLPSSERTLVERYFRARNARLARALPR